MENKKEWIEPCLEVLDVRETTLQPTWIFKEPGDNYDFWHRELIQIS
ncbi:paeninodin family lasso peptide [Paenibacillus chartarius]|uniref:Paeninodin family lasso peptide n=1 Tax=Paenibacillus chartarius TaxID=747481 RepID=A0ABV6DVV2_9BACL